MNKAEKERTEEENRKLYKIQSGASYQLRSKNAVYLNPHNTLKHEVAKAIGAYCLLKYGDIPHFSERLKAYLLHLSAEVNELTSQFPQEHSSFITEAVIKKQPGRRVDLVRLYDNTLFEFESRKTIKKEGSITIYI